jgi:hypothetical protein
MPHSNGIAALRWLRILPLLLLAFATAPAAAQALYERFIQSVTIDRSDEVVTMLARGVDPNTVDPNGDPVLVIAARSGFEPTLDALLAAGARSTSEIRTATARSWSRRSADGWRS